MSGTAHVPVICISTIYETKCDKCVCSQSFEDGELAVGKEANRRSTDIPGFCGHNTFKNPTYLFQWDKDKENAEWEYFKLDTYKYVSAGVIQMAKCATIIRTVS